MPDLNDMATFAKVVEQGGFSAAGRVLGVPKSKVSRRIALLEAALGVRLLERTTRRVRATEIGLVYYQHCKRIAEEAEQAMVSVARLAEAPRGLLRVGASVSTGQHLLGPLVAPFLERYPEIRIEMVLSNRRIDMIEEGFDVLIRIGPLEASSLIAKRLGESQLLLYASPGYLETRGPPSDPAELEGHDCLSMSDIQAPDHWRLVGPPESRPGSRKISVTPRVTVNDFPTLRHIVLSGGGIAVLPSYLCTRLERDGRLARVLPGWSLPAVEIHALTPSHRGATPKVRAFLDYFGDKIGDKSLIRGLRDAHPSVY